MLEFERSVSAFTYEMNAGTRQMSAAVHATRLTRWQGVGPDLRRPGLTPIGGGISSVRALLGASIEREKCQS
jgi:hypothetical protein